MKKRLMTFALCLSFANFAIAQEKISDPLEHQQSTDKEFKVHAKGHKADPAISTFNFIKPPEDISVNGHKIDWLFNYTTAVASIFFLVMALALFIFPYIYRPKAGHKALYHKGTTRNSIIVNLVLVAALFFSLDEVLVGKSIEYTKDFLWNTPEGAEVVKVQVMPQQWVWNFKYAGNDGTFGTADDIVTINELVVPKGRPISFEIKSKDIIHGFFIPNARQQIDAIPGKVTRMWINTTKTGDYEIACAHLCGTAHYKMKAFLKIIENEAYDSWSKERSEWAEASYDADDKLTHWGWTWGT